MAYIQILNILQCSWRGITGAGGGRRQEEEEEKKKQGIFQDLEHGGVSTNPWGGPSLPLFLLPSLFLPSLHFPSLPIPLP